jgi:hypothetical protein
MRLVSIADSDRAASRPCARTARPMICRPAIRARPRSTPRRLRRAGCGAAGPAAAARGPARASAHGRGPCQPWPGEIAVFRSAATDGFNLLTTFGSGRGSARWRRLLCRARPRASIWAMRWSSICCSGTLESVTDITLFGGPMRWRSKPPGIWEIVQAGAAELIAPGRYRLTRLLRGQRGTEGRWAIRPRPARGWWCWTQRWPRCPSPRPISAAMELAHRPGVAAGQRRDPRWPSRPRARAAALRRRMSNSRGARPQPGRSDDPLDAPVARAGPPMPGAGRGAAGRGQEATTSRSSTAAASSAR